MVCYSGDGLNNKLIVNTSHIWQGSNFSFNTDLYWALTFASLLPSGEQNGCNMERKITAPSIE